MKQVILVRQDLKLPKGKMSVQVAHASVNCLVKSHKDDKYKRMAEDVGLVTALIEDAGRTVLEPGTITCLGIGPDKEEKIDKITGKFKMV